MKSLTEVIKEVVMEGYKDGRGGYNKMFETNDAAVAQRALDHVKAKEKAERAQKKIDKAQAPAVAQRALDMVKAAAKRKKEQNVAEGSEDSFKASHNDAVEQAKSEHGDPAKHEYKFDDMSGRHGAHNSYLHYPDKKVTVNTQMYKSGPAHNVFVSRGKQGVAEGYKDATGPYKKFSGSGPYKEPLLGKEGSKRKAHIRDIVQSLQFMDASKPISADHHAKILSKLERLKE